MSKGKNVFEACGINEEEVDKYLKKVYEYFFRSDNLSNFVSLINDYQEKEGTNKKIPLALLALSLKNGMDDFNPFSFLKHIPNIKVIRSLDDLPEGLDPESIKDIRDLITSLSEGGIGELDCENCTKKDTCKSPNKKTDDCIKH